MTARMRMERINFQVTAGHRRRLEELCEMLHLDMSKVLRVAVDTLYIREKSGKEEISETDQIISFIMPVLTAVMKEIHVVRKTLKDLPADVVSDPTMKEITNFFERWEPYYGIAKQYLPKRRDDEDDK